MICVLKFLTELVFNRSGRLKFDTNSINGLIVLKETAKYVIQLLNVWDNLQNKSDNYAKKWIHLKQISHLFINMMTGNYVNFAICDYYNDTIFTDATSSIIRTIVQCDLE